MKSTFFRALLMLILTIPLTSLYGQGLEINRLIFLNEMDYRLQFESSTIHSSDFSHCLMLKKQNKGVFPSLDKNHFSRGNYSCEEWTGEELTGSLLGGALGIMAGILYLNGTASNYNLGDFIFAGIHGGSVMGKELFYPTEYDHEFKNNLDYYLWLNAQEDKK